MSKGQEDKWVGHRFKVRYKDGPEVTLIHFCECNDPVGCGFPRGFIYFIKSTGMQCTHEVAGHNLTKEDAGKLVDQLPEDREERGFGNFLSYVFKDHLDGSGIEMSEVTQEIMESRKKWN